MITEKDIKTLKYHETRSGKITSIALIALPILLIIVGVLNLYIASRYGSNVKVDLFQLIQNWFEGIDVTKQYTGMYLKAMERLETAFLDFGLALILAPLSYGFHKIRKMYSRILKSLTNNGILKN